MKLTAQVKNKSVDAMTLEPAITAEITLTIAMEDIQDIQHGVRADELLRELGQKLFDALNNKLEE